jgi:hypothetical protein
LKRSALVTKSSKSPKSRPKKTADAPAAEQSLDSVARSVPITGAPVPEDWAADILRTALRWQIDQIRMYPAKDKEEAALRAADSRTMKELVNTMEKLDAVDKRRDSKGRKSQSRDDRALKEAFIRHLDQLLAARTEADTPGKPEPG